MKKVFFLLFLLPFFVNAQTTVGGAEEKGQDLMTTEQDFPGSEKAKKAAKKAAK